MKDEFRKEARMKKKVLTMLMTIIISMSMVACGDSKETNPTNETSKEISTDGVDNIEESVTGNEEVIESEAEEPVAEPEPEPTPEPEIPEVSEPVTEEPTPEPEPEPEQEVPETSEPVVEEPVVEDPVIEEPPIVEDPVIEEPPVVEEPVVEPEPTPEPEPEPEKLVYNVTSVDTVMNAVKDCKIYTEPSTDYKKLGSLVKGQAIQVTGETDTGWYQVDFCGNTGYIKKDLLKVEVPSQPVDTRLEDGVAKVHKLVEAYEALLAPDHIFNNSIQYDLEHMTVISITEAYPVKTSDGNYVNTTWSCWGIGLAYYDNYVNNNTGYYDLVDWVSKQPDNNSILAPYFEENSQKYRILWSAVGECYYLSQVKSIKGTTVVEDTSWIFYPNHTSSYTIPLDCDGDTGLTAIFDSAGNLLDIDVVDPENPDRFYIYTPW